MANRWGNSGNSANSNFGGSKISEDGDCSHEIKRCLLLGRKVMANLDILKSRGKVLESLSIPWRVAEPLLHYAMMSLYLGLAQMAVGTFLGNNYLSLGENVSLEAQVRHPPGVCCR